MSKLIVLSQSVVFILSQLDWLKDASGILIIDFPLHVESGMNYSEHMIWTISHEIIGNSWV